MSGGTLLRNFRLCLSKWMGVGECSNGFFSSDVTAIFDVFKGQEVQIDPVTGLKKGQYWLYVDAPEGLVFGEKDSQSSVASSSAVGSVGSGANRSGSGVGSGAAESDGAGVDDLFVQEALAAGTQMKDLTSLILLRLISL